MCASNSTGQNILAPHAARRSTNREIILTDLRRDRWYVFTVSIRRLWIAFGLVVVLSFAVLGWTGIRIYQSAPPVPDRIVTTDGSELVGRGDIHAGQNVWQSMGGMEVGSVWGHGSYVAPDWTADWLHREAMFILDQWSGGPDTYRAQPPARQAELQNRLQQLLRTN